MAEHLDVDLRQTAKAAAAAAAVGAAVGMARAIATRADDAARRNGHRDEPEQEQQPEQDREQQPEQEQEQPIEAEREPHVRDDEPVQRPVRPRAPVEGASVDRVSNVTTAARQLLETLNGAEVESVSALERTPDGWRVTLETVEMRRVPDSTDMLATYEVELDDDGDLVRYERRRRYSRAQSDYGNDG